MTKKTWVADGGTQKVYYIEEKGHYMEEIRMEEIRKEKRKRRRKQRLRRRVCFLISLGLLAGGMLGVMNHSKPSKEAPPFFEINGIPVVQDLLPEGISGRPGTKKKVMFIVIHETGNQGRNANAASHGAYLQSQAVLEPLSWHYTVDDHQIYHHVPDNEVAFHAGDGLKKDGGNANGIGIELCVNPENDYEKTLENGAALTAKLMKDYDLDIEDVKKHQDFSGKNCPEKLIESGRWGDFLKMVQEDL